MIEFLYKGQKCYTNNLPKKLKRMKITENDIEILREFDEAEKKVKVEEEIDVTWTYYVFQNSKGYYLWGINKPDITYIQKFGFDISDYKLIDTCKGTLPKEYYKWNPETGTGRKDYI